MSPFALNRTKSLLILNNVLRVTILCVGSVGWLHIMEDMPIRRSDSCLHCSMPLDCICVRSYLVITL